MAIKLNMLGDFGLLLHKRIIFLFYYFILMR